MPITISRWGNSLGVRLPKDALARAHLREGDALLVEATEEGLLLRAAARSNLETLLAAITPENLHGETETGSPVGKELW
ncbi:MAG TPA: AbrB/MazE/SpoVT family DNA-binding domain-containing protein [Candidatus Dormibacteraeota bacterium]|nr:AbrB/MazE/SpoVT family DNA-binding domain-containing protein [Candidatus Dormibacteraeota bacterium]